MTPKEKARELIDKFSRVGLQQRNEGIACALIAIEILIKELDAYNRHGGLQGKIDYWQKVKTEIEKL